MDGHKNARLIQKVNGAQKRQWTSTLREAAMAAFAKSWQQQAR
jgi:hypothetical protein